MGKKGTLLLRDTIEGVITNQKTVSEELAIWPFNSRQANFFRTILSFFLNLFNMLQRQIPKFALFLWMPTEAVYLDFRLLLILIEWSGSKLAAGGLRSPTNALLNKIDNAEFFLGDAVSISVNWVRKMSLVVNHWSPTKGLWPDFIDQTLAFRPQRIVYVSCDPATQARDAASFEWGVQDLANTTLWPLSANKAHRKCLNYMKFKLVFGLAATQWGELSCKYITFG